MAKAPGIEYREANDSETEVWHTRQRSSTAVEGVGLLFLLRVTSAAARVYLIADDKTRLWLFIDGLLEQVPEAILLVGKTFRAVRVNQELIRMFGYLETEIVDRAVVSLIVPEELCKEAECFADLIAHAQTVEPPRMPKNDQRIDVSLLPVKLQAFPVGPTDPMFVSLESLPRSASASRRR